MTRVESRDPAVAGHMPDLVRLHEARWRGSGKSADPRRREFVEQLTSLGDNFPCRYTTFLRGDEPYKRHWETSSDTVHEYIAQVR